MVVRNVNPLTNKLMHLCRCFKFAWLLWNKWHNPIKRNIFYSAQTLLSDCTIMGGRIIIILNICHLAWCSLQSLQDSVMKISMWNTSNQTCHSSLYFSSKTANLAKHGAVPPKRPYHHKQPTTTHSPPLHTALHHTQPSTAHSLPSHTY